MLFWLGPEPNCKGQLRLLPKNSVLLEQFFTEIVDSLRSTFFHS